MKASAISSEIPLLAPDHGRPIPEWLLARLRATLGIDFSGVSIHLGRAASAACAALGAAAFALNERVFFAQGSPEQFSPEGLGLLAHELAHIAQQRLGAERRRASAPVIDLEAEANAAAAAVLQGSPFRVALSDARGEPACWDVAGHYYITYLMFLNAKVNPDEARRIALWCWLPDQVKEFDATTVGTNNSWNLGTNIAAKLNPVVAIGTNIGTNNGNIVNDWSKARDNLAKYEKGATWLNEQQYVSAVYAGLHSLIGGDGEKEAAKRAGHFRDESLPIFYRALALHPFGDCYAHRKFRGTFNTDTTELWGPTTLGWPIGHGLDGHESDYLWEERRWAVVCAYIRGLGRLANEYQGVVQGTASLDDIVAALSPILRGAPPLKNDAVQQLATAPVATGSVVDNEREIRPWVVPDWSKISAPARNLAKENVVLLDGDPGISEDYCALHIRKVAKQLLHNDMYGGHPRFEAVEWSEYCQRYRSMIVADAGTTDLDDVFHRIQLCAAKWSGFAFSGRLELRRTEGIAQVR